MVYRTTPAAEARLPARASSALSSVRTGGGPSGGASRRSPRFKSMPAASRRADPAPVHRVVRAEELQEGRPALGVLVEGSLEGRDDLGGLGHVLAMEPDGPGHRRHA